MGKMVGHNILGFDVPYLMRWSVLQGMKVPNFLTPFSRQGRGRYFPDVWVDTMQTFACGEFGYRKSLDSLAKALNCSGKNGNGKFFYQMTREEQEKYLTNDIVQTLQIYRPMAYSFDLWSESQSTIFDIETEPKAIELIESLAPAFKPESVKIGNLKDQDKIDAKIEDARQNHIQSILDKAGLNAEYSNPCAIGYKHAGSFDVTLDFADGDPKGLVERFWKHASKVFGNMQGKEI